MFMVMALFWLFCMCVSQMDLPGVLQPLQSADEAEGRVTWQEVDLPERSWETCSGLSDYLSFPLI